jgi:hypothetical protein
MKKNVTFFPVLQGLGCTLDKFCITEPHSQPLFVFFLSQALHMQPKLALNF